MNKENSFTNKIHKSYDIDNYDIDKNFSFDKDGKSDVINETVTENTKNTAECCPTGAIEIKEV